MERYEAKERQEIERFNRKVKSGEFKASDRYPPEKRLKLNSPYTYNIPSRSVWPLVPLYGTTIIKLYPIAEKKKFQKYHGFDIEDIPRLVEFSKGTKKIQFTLADAPTRFEGMHFLEPIFDEVKPAATTFIPLAFDLDDVDKFLALSYDHRFSDYCDKVFGELGLKPDLWDKGITYAELRYLGFHDIADRTALLIFGKRHEEALAVLAVARNVLIRPYIDPLKPIFSQLRNILEIQEPLKCHLQPSQVEFPHEIGKFLNDKLKLIVPKNMEGAIELSQGYEQVDLRNVMNALNKGIQEGNIKEIVGGTKEMSTILEEIWSRTATVNRQAKFIQKWGISLAVAAIGSIVSLPLGGYPGLLAGLGFTVVDKLLGEKVSKAISEDIVKLTTPNHVMHLYDFKKKHRLFS